MKHLKRSAALFVSLAFLALLGTGVLAAGCPHQYDAALLRQATETEPGLRQFTCILCGQSYTETIPATGHDWGEWQVERESTATEPGAEIRICRRNAEHVERREIPAKHAQKVSVQRVVGTAEAEGKTVLVADLDNTQPPASTGANGGSSAPKGTAVNAADAANVTGTAGAAKAAGAAGVVAAALKTHTGRALLVLLPALLAGAAFYFIILFALGLLRRGRRNR